MKKIKFVFLAGIFCLAVFSGCTDNAVEPSSSPSVQDSAAIEPSPSESAAPSSETPDNSPTPEAPVMETVGRSGDPEGIFTPMGGEDGVGMILYSSSELPLRSQEDTASLELYVNAQQVGGQIAWDDGQNWYLIIRDGEGIFKLVDQTYIQMGQVSYWSYWSYDEQAPHLLVMITEGAGIRVYSFVYNQEQDVFYRTEVFATEGNNSLVGSSTWTP